MKKSKIIFTLFIFLNVFFTQIFSANASTRESTQAPSLREVQTAACNNLGEVLIGSTNVGLMCYGASVISTAPMCAVLSGSVGIFSCAVCIAKPEYARDLARLVPRLRQIEQPARAVLAVPAQQTMQ